MSLSTLVYCCNLPPPSPTDPTPAVVLSTLANSSKSPTLSPDGTPEREAENMGASNTKSERLAVIEAQEARLREEIERKRAERSTLQAVLDSLQKKEAMRGAGRGGR